MPQSIPTLSELAFMYQTDKLEHGYLPFYEQHLPKNPKKLLEIGIKHGNSIRMWQKYFPNTVIHGLDLFMEFPIPDIPGIIWHQGNQCDWRILEELRNEDFDVIIEDCSHNARDQMITFFGLFNGKQYYIEDVGCNEDPFFSQGLPFVASATSVFDSIYLSGQLKITSERIKNIDENFQISKEKNIILIQCS